MQHDQISLTLRLKLAEDVLRQHLSASAEKIGLELATAIDRHCRDRALGYYPAVEYFRQVTDFDQGLIDSAEALAWEVSRLTRQQVQSRLRPIFSRVRFQSVQTEAFTLPPVRPNQSSAFERLVQHCAPNTVKIELQVSLIRKDDDKRGDAMEGYARKMAYRWLQPAFEEVEVTASHVRGEQDSAG